MVRFIWLISILLLGNLQVFSQEKMVLGSPFIRERYQLLQHITFLFDFLNFDVTQKSDKGKEFVKNNRNLYPYNPILSEDSYWCKSVWKEIQMNLSSNFHFGDYKDTRNNGHDINTYYEQNLSFHNILRKSMQNGEISVYTNDDFHVLLEPSLALYYFNSIEPNKIILKEDYWYKKETGEIYSSIISLGIKDKKGAELWLYYPEVSLALRNFFVFPDQGYTWDDCFKKQMYSCTVIRHVIDDGRDRITCAMSKALVPPNVELDALVDLKLMKEDYLWYGKFYDQNISPDLKPKTIELKCFDGSIISGQTENGIWQGEWKRIDKNGNVLLRAKYVKGIPHAKFESYYPDGKIKESGYFDFGLRNGKWKSFFESGKKQSHRNYKIGVMDDTQFYYYENGQPQIQFTYNNGLPNGACKRWYSDGQLFETGQLTDGIQSGHWTVDLKLSDECIELFNEFKNLIYFSTESFADGVLTFDGYVILLPGQCPDCLNKLGIRMRVSPEVDVYPELR
jgi:hypothetical protein